MFLPPSEQPPNSKSSRTVSARGIQVKDFERVVAALLEAELQPHFVELPPKPNNHDDDDNWPWNKLPAGAAPNADTPKGLRKKQQLQSMMQCIVAMLPTNNNDAVVRIVDFGGGTGHLSIPLALLLPDHVLVVVVDLKAASLRLVHDKARKLSSLPQQDDASATYSYPKGVQVTQHDHVKRPCAGIPNLFTYHGSMESYHEQFDLGVALHACGEASDLVLRSCAAGKASAIVMAPCCVGKLNRSVRNPYIYHATGGDAPTIQYPQSDQFRTIIQENDDDDWNALAKAADYSDWTEMRLPRNATRRAAKALLEQDRLLWLQQQQNSTTTTMSTALTRMDPWEASPKHDILLGWTVPEWSPYKTTAVQTPNAAANADLELARQYLLHTTDLTSDSAEWTRDEMQQIKEQLQAFLDANDQQQYTFPTRMGGRHRKLIHYVAQQMGLRHWGHGQLDGDKTVIVAKYYAKKNSNSTNEAK